MMPFPPFFRHGPKQYEYEMSFHDKKDMNDMVAFCTSNGECAEPKNGMAALLEIMNTRGKEGWKVVQILPGVRGILVLWVRKKKIEMPDGAPPHQFHGCCCSPENPHEEEPPTERRH